MALLESLIVLTTLLTCFGQALEGCGKSSHDHRYRNFGVFAFEHTTPKTREKGVFDSIFDEKSQKTEKSGLNSANGKKNRKRKKAGVTRQV